MKEETCQLHSSKEDTDGSGVLSTTATVCEETGCSGTLLYSKQLSSTLDSPFTMTNLFKCPRTRHEEQMW